jgi:hypothetical protein
MFIISAYLLAPAMRAPTSAQGLVLLIVASSDAVSPPSSHVACGRWPTLFVLGVQKAGTTTLSASLMRHANILTNTTVGTAATLASSACCSHAMQANNITDSSENPSNRMCHGFTNGWPKETHFWQWCLRGRRQLCAAYPALFPRYGDAFAVDMTPEYISDPQVPSALAALYPRGLQRSARFIVMLREPVARMFSAYKHYARAGWLASPTMSFDAWSQVELSVYRGYSTVEEAEADFVQADLVSSKMPNLARGFYALSLQQWRAYWPRRQILVLNFHEVFSAGGEQTARELLGQFIGLHSALAPFTHANSDPLSSSSQIGCNTSAQLQQVYAPHNLALLEMLAVDESPVGDAPSVEPFFVAFPPAPDCD